MTQAMAGSLAPALHIMEPSTPSGTASLAAPAQQSSTSTQQRDAATATATASATATATALVEEVQEVLGVELADVAAPGATATATASSAGGDAGGAAVVAASTTRDVNRHVALGARRALGQARSAAAVAGPLVEVPPWATTPNR